MKIPEIDQPVRLTWHYAAAYGLLVGPTVWLVKPWAWELPLLAQVAASLVLPAAMLLVVYFPPMFVASLVKSWTGQQRALERLILALIVLLGSVCVTVALGAGLISSMLTAVAAMGAHQLMQPEEKKANQPPEPMPLKRHGSS